jgi:hypothetical protein
MSNLQLIFNIIDTFLNDCSLISGIHVKEETGNLVVFFSDELPVSSFEKLQSEIEEQSSEHGCIYNAKDYNPKTKKFVDAHLTFFEGSAPSLDERKAEALKAIQANFK